MRISDWSSDVCSSDLLVRSRSKELAGRGVRVNAVAPGPVDTDLFRAGKDATALQRSAAMSPFNRVGRPQEVAEVVRFLASGHASWVTWQVVQPQGGLVWTPRPRPPLHWYRDAPLMRHGAGR